MTKPHRDDVARAIAGAYEPDNPTPNHHDYRATDAVLALFVDENLHDETSSSESPQQSAKNIVAPTQQQIADALHRATDELIAEQPTVAEVEARALERFAAGMFTELSEAQDRYAPLDKEFILGVQLTARQAQDRAREIREGK